MNLQRLSIHQTFGQIGMKAEPGSQSIRSPRGDQSIRQQPADLQIKSPPGRLAIDSAAAWDALGKGGNLAWSSRIYSQSKNILLQGIAKTAQDGERMGDLLSPGNPFAQIARSDALADRPSVSYTGAAGYMNVKVSYAPQDASVQVTPHKAEISYTPRKPEVQYHPGSVDIYSRQRNSIDIHVSEYDLYS
ncbi:DUF6470 domain-containing protein [Cohnella lubricantis]|uniref:Uncharacterized protein n=1 Tax=Cohnella lubricantis TaxID=2163172 RepID=A0A841TG20_9BACL|nr:DUF6470 family protein [Cohnella lubricantis]MBB6677411.1 hypothetical protein [Cohnella lubricantis]MBP2118698.1 hypothetical protein [Cohnella lubricantis]